MQVRKGKPPRSYDFSVYDTGWHIEIRLVPILYSKECVCRAVYNHYDNAGGWDAR